jgi:hypothetical protein
VIIRNDLIVKRTMNRRPFRRRSCRDLAPLSAPGESSADDPVLEFLRQSTRHPLRSKAPDLIVCCRATAQPLGISRGTALCAIGMQAGKARLATIRPIHSAAVFGEGFLPPGFFTPAFFAAAGSAAFRPSPALNAREERCAE